MKPNYRNLWVSYNCYQHNTSSVKSGEWSHSLASAVVPARCRGHTLPWPSQLHCSCATNCCLSKISKVTIWQQLCDGRERKSLGTVIAWLAAGGEDPPCSLWRVSGWLLRLTSHERPFFLHGRTVVTRRIIFRGAVSPVWIACSLGSSVAKGGCCIPSRHFTVGYAFYVFVKGKDFSNY